MFATLRYGREAGNLQAVEQSHSLPLSGQGTQHNACAECRQKKLKCTGEKLGCSRCCANGMTCVYPDSKSSLRGAKQQKKRTSPGADPTPSSRKKPNTPRQTTCEVDVDSIDPHQLMVSSENESASKGATVTDTEGDEIRVSSRANPGVVGGSMDFVDRGNMNDIDMLTMGGVGQDLADTSYDAFAGDSSGDADMMAFDTMLRFTPEFLEPEQASLFPHQTVEGPDGHQIEQNPFRSDNDYGPRAHPPRDRGARNDNTGALPGRMNAGTSSSTASRSGSLAVNMWPARTPRDVSNVISVASSGSCSDDDPSRICSCTDRAIRLLERVHFAPWAHMPVSALFGMLAELRKCLQSVTALARCKQCTNFSSYLTLLGIIVEKLVTALARLVQMSNNLTINGEDSMAPCLTDGYNIDSSEEFVALFGAVAMRLAVSVRKIIGDLGQKCRAEKWKVPFKVLQGGDERLSSVESRLRQGDPGDWGSFR